MKNKSYANRGRPFEELMRFANERYAKRKIAVIEKLPTEFIPIRNTKGKICDVKVERKSKVDFIGRYKHIPIAIEAKHTEEDTIRFNRVETHQADYMDAVTEEPGTIGLVLVSFGMKRFFVIPWAHWKAAYDARVRPTGDSKAPVSVSAFGVDWTIPKKKSVRIDEIPPEFEIPNHDFDFGLHYLQTADRYITPQYPTATEKNAERVYN